MNIKVCGKCYDGSLESRSVALPKIGVCDICGLPNSAEYSQVITREKQMSEFVESFLGIPVVKIGGFPYGEWRTEPPTEPGWYFAWNPYWAGRRPTALVDVDFDKDGVLAIVIVGTDYMAPLSTHTHWLGPLPVPEMPK